MSIPAPLMTLPQIQADLALLARNRTLLDPFLQLQTTESSASTSTSTSPTGQDKKKIDPVVLPAGAAESLEYAQGFVQATRKGVLEISEGSAVGEMGGRLERVKGELEGLSVGLQGH